MGSIFDNVTERRNTCSLKWDFCESRFGKKDILPMWVADMDFPSPAEVQEAIRIRAEHGIYGYTGIPDELTEAILNWTEKRHNWRIKAEWTVHSPGVVTSINIAILAYTDVGDKVLIQSPVYYPFYSSIKDNDRQVVTNSLINNDGYYEIDFADLESKLADDAKLMILCSPHNPVGRVWKLEELKRISELCIKYNVLLISDEIHWDLVFKDHKHIPTGTVSNDILQNSITCISPTKTFNLAGLSESVAVIPNAELRQKFQKTLYRTGAGMLNIFGLEAARAAYAHGEKWLEDLMGYLTENLNILIDYFDKNIPGIKVTRPEATYLAWLDCRELTDRVENLKEFFVFKAALGMNDGIQFGVEGRGFQRINFACPRTLLLDGLQRIEKVIKSL